MFVFYVTNVQRYTTVRGEDTWRERYDAIDIFWKPNDVRNVKRVELYYSSL